jgi:hypothetical protein
MATVTQRGHGVDYAEIEKADRATGWIGYAAIMLVLAGGWNVFDGILAISRSKVFVANASYVFSDLRTWGWIILFLGIAELAAGLMIMSGSQVARWFGIVAAGVNAIGQLMFLHAYPFWSLAMFAADMLIIYALAVYGGRKLDLE